MDLSLNAALGAMTLTTQNWVRVIHVFGFLVWIGSLFALYELLYAHAKAGKEAQSTFVDLEKKTAMAMDIGASVAMLGGIYFAIRAHLFTGHGGWLHAKLLLVAIIIGFHGFARVKVRKYRNGDIKPVPAIFTLIMTLTVLGIIILALVRPF